MYEWNALKNNEENVPAEWEKYVGGVKEMCQRDGENVSGDMKKMC